KSVKTTHPVFRSAQLNLQHPVPVGESFFLSNSELSEDSSGLGRAGPSFKAVLQSQRRARRHQRVFSLHHKKDGDKEFFPLPAAADWRELRGRREADLKAARNYPLPSGQTTRLNEHVEKELPAKQRTHSSGSLDELWIKFLECQKRHQHHDFRRNGELSLVERLD
ncbi:hypothetical protein M959_08233, partial [Chaetura pelagica]